MDRGPRRIPHAVAVVAALAGSLIVAATGDPAGADPALDVPVTTVAVGQPLTFTATECSDASGGGDGRYLDGSLVVGTGADAVRAGIVDYGMADGTSEVIPMGWVDPEEPAALAVRCIIGTEGGPVTVAFSYPEVAIDVVAPAEPVPFLDVAVDRTAAAAGQAIGVSGSGCQDTAIVELYAGTDRSFRTIIPRNPDSQQELSVEADGTFDAPIYLNGRQGPLAEGPYVLSTFCDLVPEDRGLAEAVVVTVDGTNPTDAIDLAWEVTGPAVLSGSGCTGGRTLAASWVSGVESGDVFDDVPGDATVTPADDGTWSLEVGDPAWRYLDVTAACGDPEADGFQYLTREAYRNGPEWSTTTTTTSGTTTVPPGTATPAAPIAGSAAYTG